jgi:hypothetical protein
MGRSALRKKILQTQINKVMSKSISYGKRFYHELPENHDPITIKSGEEVVVADFETIVKAVKAYKEAENEQR